MKKYLLIAIVLLLVAAAAWGPLVSSNVELARYHIVSRHGAIEIRDYEPMIVAETTVSGPRDEAANKAFRVIADYIFGNNKLPQEVTLAEPKPAKSTKIAMTAPVMQRGKADGWTVRFAMPAGSKIDKLPVPNNKAVHLKEISGKRFATMRFSGSWSNDNLRRHAWGLRKFIKAKKLQTKSGETYAFFNPPWTLPFLRRNEVMIEIVK
jgi:hypothetical protein